MSDTWSKYHTDCMQRFSYESNFGTNEWLKKIWIMIFAVGTKL